MHASHAIVFVLLTRKHLLNPLADCLVGTFPLNEAFDERFFDQFVKVHIVS